MLHCNNSIPEKRCRNTFFLITSLFAKGFQLQDMQWNRNDKSDCRNACKSFIQSQAACNTWKCVCYSVTREIWKSHKKSGKSQEALTRLVLQNGSVYQLELPKMINELLLIKFDISFYVRYRSEEISPPGHPRKRDLVSNTHIIICKNSLMRPFRCLSDNIYPP